MNHNGAGNDPGLLSRRSILRVGSLSFFGLTLSQYLGLQRAMAATGNAPAAKAQSVILLWLNGGPSHVDTWDPKTNSSFKPISTNVPGIQISELLPRMARHMDKMAIIRSMHTLENNHGIAHHYAMTGHRPSPAMKFPALGAIISKELGEQHSVPPYVMVPDIGDFRDYFCAQMLGARYDPMDIPDPSQKDFKIPDLSLPDSVTVERIEQRRAMAQLVDAMYREQVVSAEHTSMNVFQQQALDMILSPAVRDAFDLSKESEKLKDTYGRHTVGQSALIARRLVEAGSRFVTIVDRKRPQQDGIDWDTHNKNDEKHRDILVPVLDGVLSTLLTDLEERGLLSSTIVIAMGEFGRTPDINPNGGRDHWNHCWSLVLGGGGIRGGTVVGESDERGAYVKDHMVTIGHLFATLYKALGIDWTKEYMHPIGRPLKIANSIDDKTGTPLQELV